MNSSQVPFVFSSNVVPPESTFAGHHSQARACYLSHLITKSSILTILHFWYYQLLCEAVLFWYYSLNNLSYCKTSFLLVGQGRFRINSEILMLAQLNHSCEIYPCYVPEQTYTISEVLLPSFGEASSLTLQIYFNYLISLAEIHKALNC